MIDNKAEKYYGITQYAYAINNPLRFIDPDGNDIVDAKGHKVQIRIKTTKNGSFIATYKFTNNTSQNTKTKFMNNAGRFINEAIKIPTGRKYVNAAKESNEKIHYTISGDKSFDDKGDIQLGITKDMRDEKGEIIKTSVTIFEGSIKKASTSGVGNQLYKLTKLNDDQKVAVTGIHETHHATNPKDIKVRREERRKLTPEEHEAAYSAGQLSAIEFGDNNKAYEDDKK